MRVEAQLLDPVPSISVSHASLLGLPLELYRNYVIRAQRKGRTFCAALPGLSLLVYPCDLSILGEEA
jgi:hypothetical protein